MRSRGTSHPRPFCLQYMYFLTKTDKYSLPNSRKQLSGGSPFPCFLLDCLLPFPSLPFPSPPPHTHPTRFRFSFSCGGTRSTMGCTHCCEYPHLLLLHYSGQILGTGEPRFEKVSFDTFEKLDVIL